MLEKKLVQKIQIMHKPGFSGSMTRQAARWGLFNSLNCQLLTFIAAGVRSAPANEVGFGLEQEVKYLLD